MGTKGMRFRHGGDDTPPDADKARSNLSAATKLSHAEAQFEFCVLLGEYGEWPEAVGWLEKSVSLGFGPAQRYLADGLSDSLISDHLHKHDYSEAQLYRRRHRRRGARRRLTKLATAATFDRNGRRILPTSYAYQNHCLSVGIPSGIQMSDAIH
jgi:hypothetical protein